MNKLLCWCATILLAGLGSARAEEPPPVTLRLLPERETLYRKSPGELILQVEVVAQRAESGARSPLNLAVALDRSGSMTGAKIEKARQAAAIVVDQLQDDDFFSLITYDHQAEVVAPVERVGSRAHRQHLQAMIQRVRPGGSTALHAGVTLAGEQVRKVASAERVNRVILLSDGLANVGPKSVRELSALGQSLREQRVAVSTIGVGDDYHEDLMTALAEAGNGNYYYVQDAEKLPAIFEKELNATTRRMASNVIIRVQAPAGVRLREIVGHPEIRCEEGSVEIKLAELFSAEKRQFQIRCTVTSSEGERSPLANATLCYEDTAEVTRNLEESAGIRWSDDAKLAEASARPEVQQAIAVQGNRLSKEQAVRLADEGKPEEAVKILRSQVAANASASPGVALPNVDQENRQMEGWAQELERQKQLSSSSRKGAQWENYQDKYQKR